MPDLSTSLLIGLGIAIEAVLVGSMLIAIRHGIMFRR
jgi:hypothetical protein